MQLEQCLLGAVVTHAKKGGIYYVIGIGHDSEDRDRMLVLYYSHTKKRIWVRPARPEDKRDPAESAFCEDIVLHGKTVERFSLISMERLSPEDAIQMLTGIAPPNYTVT